MILKDFLSKFKDRKTEKCTEVLLFNFPQTSHTCDKKADIRNSKLNII